MFHIWHLLMLPCGFKVLKVSGIGDEHFSVEEAKKNVHTVRSGGSSTFFALILLLTLKSAGREGHTLLEVSSFTWYINLRS